MPQHLVSVIIPFYNEELLLERAVNSALRQSYAWVEIILVNDGSTDGSLKIATAFEENHSNIQCIDAKHNSLGHARNLGIAISTGFYIAFLDSDDELENSAIEKLVRKMEAEDSDIVVSKFSSYNALGQMTGIYGWKVMGKPIAGSEAVCKMYEHAITYTAWAKLYRLELVKEISFPEGLWFEDRPFLLTYFLRSKTVSFEMESLWKIHSRKSSITRRIIVKKHMEDTCQIFLLELSAIEGTVRQKEFEAVLFRHQIGTLMNTLLILCSDRRLVKKLSELEGCFDDWIKDFVGRLKKANISIGKKAWLDLQLLKLYEIIGWRLTYLLLPYLKRTKYKGIIRLRN